MKHLKKINEFFGGMSDDMPRNEEEFTKSPRRLSESIDSVRKPSRNSKLIKKDYLGLYVNCDGRISRPFYGTSFKEGDRVRTNHMSGSTHTRVTKDDDPEIYNFKRDGLYEYWEITGVYAGDYRTNMTKKNNYGQAPFSMQYSDGPKQWDTFLDYMEEMTDWYKRNSNQLSGIYIDHNKKFE